MAISNIMFKGLMLVLAALSALTFPGLMVLTALDTDMFLH
jgi:hypothetical protein